MKSAFTFAAIALISSAGNVFAHDEEALQMSPPGEPYIQVSDVLPLPAFIPGLGTLFVDPGTLSLRWKTVQRRETNFANSKRFRIGG